MRDKISILAIGALFTNNFGDILLARMFAGALDPCTTVLSPSHHKKIEEETRIKKAGFRDIMCADHVVFIGGGYFSEPPERISRWALSRYRRIFVWGDICRILRKKYSIIGVGAGPLDTPLPRFFIRRLCNGAEKIVVRDRLSRDMLVKIGVRKPVTVAADHVLSLSRPRKEPRTDIVQIGFHTPAIPAATSLIPVLPGEKAFWYINDHVAEGPLPAQARLPCFENRVILYRQCDIFIDQLNALDFIVTSKLHVGIVAAALGKRICAIPRHAKIRRFYEDIGRPELCYAGDLEDGKGIKDHIERCFHAAPVIVPAAIRDQARSIDSHIRDMESAVRA